MAAQLIAVCIVGVLASSAWLAVGLGATIHDAALVVGLAALGSMVAAIAGAFGVRRLRRWPLRIQVLAIALAASLTTVGGVLVAAAAMFISNHDVGVLVVVVMASTAVSAGAATALGSSFERSAGHLGALAQELATGPLHDAREASGELVTGELHGLAGQLRDLALQLEQSRERERALDASRRELTAWVSHDLRSPIASIRAMAEALEDGVVDDAPSIARYHRTIRKESERLGLLVDDLFELSRITAGAIDESQPLVPLGELVSEVIDGAEPTALAHRVRIVNLFDDAPGVLVPAADLQRVLHNLLDNAVRHTRPGGVIVVDGEIGARSALVRVSDECGGIPDADLPRLFDVAFRGDTARTRDEGGGGLGLAIAKGLLEAHHGTIDAANRATGCQFTVRLPVTT